jgi:hypothetical protein
MLLNERWEVIRIDRGLKVSVQVDAWCIHSDAEGRRDMSGKGSTLRGALASSLMIAGAVLSSTCVPSISAETLHMRTLFEA